MAIMTTFLLLLGSVLSLFSVVNGGNHLWERPFIATNNDTHHHSIHKRQLVIVPGDGVAIWPSRTLKYCFKDKQSGDKMGASFVSAMTVWWGSGLPQGEDGFKIELVKDSQCRKNRKDVLLITYNADGILTSSVGKISADPSKGIDGPFIYVQAV
ncbi:hypothetical protein HYFRA_00009168 [Hymenoscyphus fraxineus]|uniref:Uncharacterized protein n=1 Tax=Hymenoscyphus fraxineus TaxID=746836 RepID=A0A9N9PU14_9HELO|nr:hypothetical protein HYFRA_00009168 [Hymenoscyphus fraxineus]